MNQEKLSDVSSPIRTGTDGDKWLKRPANNSEEELSEGSSSGSDANQIRKGMGRPNLKKDAQTNMKARRPSRQSAAKRKWLDDFKANKDSDPDWNDNDTELDGHSSDSDPVWSPTQKQRNQEAAVTPPDAVKMQRAGRKPKGWSPAQTQTVSPIKAATKENISDDAKSDVTVSLNDHEMRLQFAGFTSSIDESTYESGKFIMLKSDFKRQKNPCMWRIDGKNLLQKYEPIIYKGNFAFRNISTYSSWTPTNQGLYVPVETDFAFQSKAETVVTFNTDTVMLPVRSDVAARINQESADIQDTFQIYLQTLISQALDSNFLAEIVRENDEYFLMSISAVEDQWVSPRLSALKEKRKWPPKLSEPLECFPVFETGSVTSGEKCCVSCGGRNPTRKFTFQTTMYHYDSLKMTDSNKPEEVHLLCLSCTDSALLYHQLFHFRFNLFVSCTSKIKEVCAANSESDGPTTLKTCLADQQWTSDMLRQASLILAEAEQYV